MTSAERHVSLNSVVAWSLWACAVLVAMANWFVPPSIGYVATLFGAAAGTMHLWALLNRRQKEAIREAFELGRESGFNEATRSPQPPLQRVR